MTYIAIGISLGLFAIVLSIDALRLELKAMTDMIERWECKK